MTQLVLLGRWLRTAFGLVVAIPVALIAGLFAAVINEQIGSLMTELEWDEACSNHARFEGTWTPKELRLRQARREIRRMNEAEWNHARAEGYQLRTVAGESP